MPTPIDRRRVKVMTFNQDIAEALKYADTVLFQGSGEVDRIIGKDNKNGTQNIDYVVRVKLSDIKKSDTEISIPEDLGIKVHKERSESQQTRFLAYTIGKKIGVDPEQLYKEAQEAAREYIRNKEFEFLKESYD